MTVPGRRRGWLASSVVSLSLAFATGCEGDPEPVPCNAAPECPIVDEDATDEDVRVLWAEGQKLEL